MVWGKKYISLQLSQVERSFQGTLKRRDVPSLGLLLLLVLPVTFCLDKVKLKNEPWVYQNTIGKLWPFVKWEKICVWLKRFRWSRITRVHWQCANFPAICNFSKISSNLNPKLLNAKFKLDFYQAIEYSKNIKMIYIAIW